MHHVIKNVRCGAVFAFTMASLGQSRAVFRGPLHTQYRLRDLREERPAHPGTRPTPPMDWIGYNGGKELGTLP